MIEVCKRQAFTVVKQVDFGIYLANEEHAHERVLLPAKEVPGGTKIGDVLEAFIYRDSQDRLIATTRMPKIQLDAVAALTVTDVTKIGAFLDWGLEKDLFLPYKEMRRKVRENDTILVRLYVDKSNRPAASMKGIYERLSARPVYIIGDTVHGRIYEFGHDFGTFVAVDDKFSAMIPKHEDVKGYRIGDVIEARVTGIKEDGKLDLSLRKKAYAQIEEDAASVMEIIESYAGVLPFTEKADPQVIARETGLSKAAFKRAVGHLYKERKIVIEDGRIRKV